jgi:hypothetical protein
LDATSVEIIYEKSRELAAPYLADKDRSEVGADPSMTLVIRALSSSVVEFQER